MRSEIPLWTLRGIGLALGVVLVYALLQLGIAAARVFLLVFIAVLLASALEPMLGWLRHRVSVLSRAGTILVVYLTFIVTDAECEELIELVRREHVRLFYARIPAHFGVINPDAKDPPEAGI